MSIKQATRDSWNRNVMPEAKVQLEVEQTFSQEEFAYLQQGLIPYGMDDRWFIYFEDGWLFLHRSWTGTCVYQVRLQPIDDGWKTVEVWANGDPEQFRPGTLEENKRLLLGVLRLCIQKCVNSQQYM